MIDFESEVYNRICDRLEEVHGKVYTATESDMIPSFFPAVSVEMTNLVPTAQTMDSSCKEKYSTGTITVNIYTNKSQGKKQEAKNIANTIDTLLTRMNFSRSSMMPVPNKINQSIYRITSVYNVVSDGKYFYRG